MAGGSSDPTPANNILPVELNVIDHNDPDQAAVHESFVKSAEGVTVSVARGRTTAVSTRRVTVGNADANETPGDAITVTASDGTCPLGTVGVADFDPGTPAAQNTVTVGGGVVKTGLLPLTINGAAFTTVNNRSPARCTAVISASSAGAGTDASNNTTKLVIDVVDKNDF